MKLKTIETPILAEMYAAHKRDHRCWRRYWGVWLCWWGAGIAGWVGCLVFAIWHIPWLLWPAAVLLAGSAVGATIHAWHYSRIPNEVARRASQVPLELLVRACRYYRTESYPWECSAIECHEAHIPGDCPLCGAE